MDDLTRARAALCDLMMGRRFRAIASGFLEAALHLEQFATPAPILDDLLAQGAHAEWFATRTEQGLIRWGNRLNRCGYQPADVEDG